MRVSAGCLLGSLLLARATSAATITVHPADGWAPLEAAQAGDTVLLAPGIYPFRVSFENQGRADAPITLRALDPADPPVFDPSPSMVSSAPGSYTGGDKGRGCWQFRGGHYRVDGVVFRNCVDHSSSGIRVVNVPDIQVRNCLFQTSTNGFTGAGDGMVIEYSEFDRNGDALPGDNAAHQIYVFGGTLEVRFSYFHDSPAGQAFHVRARDATLEYNWITRPGSYVGDIMTCEYLCGASGTSPVTQRMLLRGNVIVQEGASNLSQTIALYNDEPGGTEDDTGGEVELMELTLVANTFVGTPRGAGQDHEVVHACNDTVATRVHATNNAVLGYAAFTLVESPTANNWSVDGAGNWLTTGTDATGLSGSIFALDPGLSSSYVPIGASPLIGKAASSGALVPAYEYYRDESVKLQGRLRESVRDIGAFESTTQTTPFGGGNGPIIPPAPGPAITGSGCGSPSGADWLALLGPGLAALLRRGKARIAARLTKS
jgi:hypothetical protein